ncbi:hypothetical protein B0H14DRAFT_3477456 [Mycena olivaceomarginata]|nr:hypothetical protein B0H14DRAFT_3477456 [Mycena olivaceomarginata]
MLEKELADEVKAKEAVVWGGVGGDGGDGGQRGGKGGLGEGSVFPIGARQSSKVHNLIIGGGIGGTGGSSGIPWPGTIQDSQTPEDRRVPTSLEQILGGLMHFFTAATQTGYWLVGGLGGEGGYGGGEGGTGQASILHEFLGCAGKKAQSAKPTLLVDFDIEETLRNLLFKQGFVTVGGLFEVTDHDLRNHLEIGHILTLKEKLHDFVRE